jgi:hypothetical protein
MSTEIQRASAEAVAAAVQSDRYAEILAVVAAVQAVQAAPQPTGCGCTPAKPRRSAGQVAALAAGVCACVGVATAALLAVALVAVAVGVSAVVLLLLVRQLRKGK